MGFFHEGHLSLMRAAVAGNDVVVASVFVNPLQFGAGEDLEEYPRDLERDKDLAHTAGVTHLFIPEVGEMYPEGRPRTRIDVGRIGEVCEGRYRPGHFSGVATVCVKLLNMVRPDRAYFGEKDAQQLAVIRQVVRDLNLAVEIVGCPTVRDANGVALSSRNARLSPEGLQAARALSQALFHAAGLVLEGDRPAEVLKEAVLAVLGAAPDVDPQYVEVVDGSTFEPVERAADGATVAAAAFVEGVRLIDNVRLRPQASRPGTPAS